MGVTLRLVPPAGSAKHPAETAADPTERAWQVIEDMRIRGKFERTAALADPADLRETLSVVGEFDLDVLVRIAAEAIVAAPRRLSSSG